MSVLLSWLLNTVVFNSYAHKLKLVLTQWLVVLQGVIFFITLVGFATLFSKSARTDSLDTEIKKLLPRLAPTRWLSLIHI